MLVYSTALPRFVQPCSTLFQLLPSCSPSFSGPLFLFLILKMNCLICPYRKKTEGKYTIDYHFGSLDYWIHMSLMDSYMKSKWKNAQDEWILAKSFDHFWNQACSLLSNWPSSIFNWIHLQMLKLCTIKLLNGAKIRSMHFDLYISK